MRTFYNTTMVQEKGIILGKNPLKQLAKYRNFGSKLVFVSNFIGFGLVKVYVGDEIKVLSRSK